LPGSLPRGQADGPRDAPCPPDGCRGRDSGAPPPGLGRGAPVPSCSAPSIPPFQPKPSLMKIEKDRVVRLHYTVSEQGQEPLESSKEREPLAILAGRGNIIPGLDKALEGREAGESFAVDVPAAEAYGERREGLTQRIPKKYLGAQKLSPGMQVVL